MHSKLQVMRIQKNYSCQFMANRLQISKTYYWQIENRKRRLTYDLALRIANIFNTSPDCIFYDFEKLAKERK